MGTPGRHGHDWSQVPVPARRLEGGQASSSSSSKTSTSGTSAAKEAVAGTIPVELLHAFYQALPPYGIQHFALTFQIPYRAPEFLMRTVGLMTLVREVPQGLVYVITDMTNFMTIPGAALNAPEQQLDDYALLGLLRFRLLIGDRAPMILDSIVSSPNAPAPGAVVGLQTGWSVLNETFGAKRSGGFAVYARSRQSVKVEVIPDDVPEFLTSRAGCHMHGFTVPEATFDEIFRKHR